jgi:hypothetical protein
VIDRMRNNSHNPTDHPSADGKPGDTPSFGRLAKRITAWTTNILATAIVLVAALGIGRQVRKWWGVEGNPASPAEVAIPGGQIGDPEVPHVLHFGDQPWSIQRQTVQGGEAQATTALRAACRQALEKADFPATPPGREEQNLLAKLQRQTPVAEELGAWRLFEPSEGVPLVVGVRESPNQNHPEAGTELAETARRVVVWGLAVPEDRANWSLYSFRLESGSSKKVGLLPELPYPPGGRRLLSVTVGEGGALAAFSGRQESGEWKPWYEDWFAQRGWKPAGAWRVRGTGWHLRYVSPDEERPAAVDVQFGPDGRGQWTGMVMVSPGLVTKESHLP